MTTVANPYDLIDKATERANAPRKSGKPVFLFLKEGEKALIRPLYNLDQSIIMNKHSKWHDNRDYRVSAICAKETAGDCLYCDMAKETEDKKLEASSVFYVPIFVYQVVDVKSGQKILYKEKDESGNEQEKPVSGFRVLELPLFGAAFIILQSFRSYVRDDGPIHECDWGIEQSGSHQAKKFLPSSKAAKTLHPKISSAIPALGRVREAVIGACPPVVMAGSSAAVKQGATTDLPSDSEEGEEYPF